MSRARKLAFLILFMIGAWIIAAVLIYGLAFTVTLLFGW